MTVGYRLDRGQASGVVHGVGVTRDDRSRYVTRRDL